MSIPTPLANAIAFIKSDLEVNLIPVIIGALQILAKSPNALGVAAAEAYVLGNAPTALLAVEQAAITQGIAALSAFLQAEITKAAAPAAVTSVTIKPA